MPDPDVMVATVGLNPLPVVLAVLTRKRELGAASLRVILVHSDASKAEAEAVGEHFRGSDQGIEVTSLLSCGSAAEFATTRAVFDQLRGIVAETGTREFLLDYTGGNKIMTACAIWAHLEAHDGGGERWRSYIDNTTGQLVTGSIDAGAGAIDVVSSGLDLGKLARLHGFELSSPSVDVTGLDLGGLREAITRADKGMARADLEEVLYAWTDSAGICREWVAGRVARPGGGRLSDQELQREVRGLLREVLVAGTTAQVVGARADTEIRFSAEIRVKGSPPSSKPTAECDLLVRTGHRVLHIEVKSSAYHARRVLGQRTVFSRFLFGSSTTTVIAADEGRGEVGWANLIDSRDRIITHAPWLGNADVWRIDGADGSPDSLRAGLERWLSPQRDQSHGGRNQPPSDCAVAVPYNGTRLAVAAAVQAAGEYGGVGGVTGVGRADRSQQQWIRGQNVGARAEIASFSEAATAARITGAKVAVITPGPKGVTAGLIRAVYPTGTVVHVGLDGTRHVLGGEPRPVPETGALPWAAAIGPKNYSPDAEGARRQVTVDIVTALGRHVGFTEWWRKDLKLRELDSNPRPELLITGSRGACSVHVLDLTGVAHKDRGRSLREFRSAILSSSAEAVDLIGDAHRPLILLHTVNRWNLADPVHAAGGFQNDGSWRRFAKVGRWLPLGLWRQRNGTVDVLADFDAIQTHLHGKSAEIG
ncbi:hypothetical protein [Nocardia thailandica]